MQVGGVHQTWGITDIWGAYSVNQIFEWEKSIPYQVMGS